MSSSSCSQNDNQLTQTSKRQFEVNDQSTRIDDTSRTGGEAVHIAKRLSTEPGDGGRDKSMFISICISDYSNLGILVSKNDTVYRLQERLAMATDIPVHEQKLIYKGKQLDSAKWLKEYGVEEESTVQMGGKLDANLSIMWKDLDQIVKCALRLCKGEHSSNVYIDIFQRNYIEIMVQFVWRVEFDEMRVKYLKLFISLSVGNALSTLYLSLVRDNKLLGARLIYMFIDATAMHRFSWELYAYAAAPIVLQICVDLRKEDPYDSLYIHCRTRLCSLVYQVFCLGSTPEEDRNLVTCQEIFPFVLEIGNQLLDLDLDIFATGFEAPMLMPEARFVSDFEASLSAVMIHILKTVNLEDPIGMLDGVLEHPFCEQLQSLHRLFFDFLNKVDLCLLRVYHYSSTEDGQESLTFHWPIYYLFLLRALNDISKIYIGARENFKVMLEKRKNALRAIVMIYLEEEEIQFKRDNWLVEHKEYLGFECRSALAMKIIPYYRAADDEEVYKILIDRSQLFAESFKYLLQADPKSLQNEELYVQFKNEDANGPGVLREWLLLVTEEIFTIQNALFLTNPNDLRRFYINPATTVDPKHLLDYFLFCGRVIALALKYGVRIGIVFDHVLFLQLSGLSVTLEDIKDTDPTLYRSCQQILKMEADLIDSDALGPGLTFVTEYEFCDSRKEVELIPDGGQIKVNSNNRAAYVNALVHHRFVVSTRSQVANLSKGFEDILSSPEHLKFFLGYITLEDLDLMLTGGYSDISVDDWKAHTKCEGYESTDPQIKWFWKIITEMTAEQRRQMLFFWTAIKYLPVKGFSGLSSHLEIHKALGTIDHLPMSHTCYNQICLPEYPTFKMMQQRVAIVIQEHVSSGFGNV